MWGEMLIFSEIPVSIDLPKVLRYMGQPVHKQSLEILEHIRPMVSSVKHLVHPQAICTDLTVTAELVTIPVLRCCKTASVIAVTVGKAIEEEINQLFNVKKTTAGLATDALGTVAVEEAANWVLELKGRQQRVKGLYATTRTGPGYPGVELMEVSRFLALAGADQIGLSCDEYGNLHPKKSLVFLVGWSHFKTTESHKCNRCKNISCQFREKLKKS